MKRERKVLIAVSEIFPFAKTGGLADVVGALPGPLEKNGAEVRLVMPLYGSVDQKKFKMKPVGNTISIPMAGETVEVNIRTSKSATASDRIYFIECEKYFGRDGLYGDQNGDYADNAERFALFARAILEMLKVIDYKPDVIHCNDWQTGMIPTYLKNIYQGDDFYRNISTVMTIHNIAYQGVFPANTMEKIGLPWDIFNSDGVEYWGNLSYLKAGMVYADVINTVSETYAREIQESNTHGQGLEGLLKYRSNDLYGILNGIDYDVWNPGKDEMIASNYDNSDLRGKSRCRKTLQKENRLPADKTPILGMISRLADQKGLDILSEALERIMERDLQLIILGTGERNYEEYFKSMADKYPEKMSVNIGFDEGMAHQIYAGSDIFLMPSRYEPCGLSQMIALKYGTLPLAHKTGGLADTVIDYNGNPTEGNGFVFDEYSSESLLDTLDRALEVFSNKRKWNGIVKTGMELDHSWKNSARRYMDLYEKAMEKNAVTVS